MAAGLLFLVACGTSPSESNQITAIIDHAAQQQWLQVEKIRESGRVLNPRTVNADGSVKFIKYSDWTSGFFPGSMWYMYELTGDPKWLPVAQEQTQAIDSAKYLTWHHDIGFIIECSFGNGLRLSGNKAYEEVIVTAAQSLSTRFRPVAGIIQSWDVTGGWQAERGWECPVIVDNMMNLELLFHATALSGDSSFYKIAVSHADRTMQEQFRPDGSAYHVIDYSLTDGSVRNRHTAQGYAHESAWSRGQSWAIYGYTVMYRATGERKYLDQAIRTFEFMKNHKNMPADRIPYWDMDAPDIPNELRDASSAAIMASALYEISTYETTKAGYYKEYADQIIASLASPAYTAELGTNGNFILMHSVGSIPHNQEIDVPINYADYYYLEAVKRKRDIEQP